MIIHPDSVHSNTPVSNQNYIQSHPVMSVQDLCNDETDNTALPYSVLSNLTASDNILKLPPVSVRDLMTDETNNRPSNLHSLPESVLLNMVDSCKYFESNPVPVQHLNTHELSPDSVFSNLQNPSHYCQSHPVSATNTNTTANQQIIGTNDGDQKTSKKKMDTSSSLKNTTIIEGKIYTNNNNDSKANSDTTITNPQETDVLCGRGSAIIRHPGNLAFRRLVDEYKERYIICVNTKMKKCISESIVKIIRKQNGRFLARSTNRNFWMDIGDKKAIAKTSQRLREGQAQQIMVNKFTTNNTCSQTLREDQSKQKTLSDQLVGTSGPLVQQQQQYGNEPQSQSRQLQSESSPTIRPVYCKIAEIT